MSGIIKGEKFYAFNVQISPRSVWSPNLIRIDPILSINDFLCHMVLLRVRGLSACTDQPSTA